jgi:hypothetical protein
MRREKLYPGRYANTWLAAELDQAMLGAETIDEVRANLREYGWSDEDIEACELDELFRYGFHQ